MAMYKYNNEHFHDAEGYLFIPNLARDETLWEAVVDGTIATPDDVFIRDYNDDGSINGYWTMDELMDYVTLRHHQLRDYRTSTRESIAAVVKFFDDRKLPLPAPGDTCLRYIASPGSYPHLDFDGEWLNDHPSHTLDLLLAQH